MILWSVHSSLWQNCEENLVGGSVGLAIHVHIKKSHNFAVKKGRVAHILVPFMVGAICGLALFSRPQSRLKSGKEHLRNSHSHHHFQNVFFFCKMDRKLAHLQFWSLGQISCKKSAWKPAFIKEMES